MLDLQALVDRFEPMTCIISVEVFPDGGYGNIRIVCGNKAYVDSIEKPDNMTFSEMLKNKFVPDSPYEHYIPHDLNFEDTCYRCAVRKKPFHTYIHPERYPFWVDMYLMPLASDRENVYYCTYTMELTQEASSERMAKIDGNVSESILETCIKLRSTQDFRHTMDEVISDIRKICGAEKCCILLTNSKKRECSVLCESHVPDRPEVSMISYIQNNYKDFYAIVETWESTIAGSTCLIIQNESDMEVLCRRNPAWHHSMQAVGVRSIVLYPLSYNNELIGYIWALNFDTDKTMKIRATLETTSYFVASEIANHQMLNRLEVMSSVDMLTGVGNRNAMNRRVDELLEETAHSAECFAVVFADLNGLKQVNDNGGHADGDQLLKDAAAVFRNVFHDSEIYRAGGDEFMVLNTGISREEFERRICRLRAYSEDPDMVSFSLGSCYSAGDCDIRKVMRTADKQMYLDKQHFYETHPDRRRR